jgi:hypothetical protein
MRPEYLAPTGLCLRLKGNRLDAAGRSAEAFGIHRLQPVSDLIRY